MLYLLGYPTIRAHWVMLIALIEQWSSTTSTFHLSTGDIIVTLEDVWHILRLPITGHLVSEVISTGAELDHTI